MSRPDRQRILVIASYHLSRAGFSVEVASDPRQGLDRAIEQSFDLILLDLMMPGLDGEELLALLKPLNLHHRVVVVTAHAGDHYRSRMRDLGSADYVEKPVNPDELVRVVTRVLEAAGRPLQEGVGYKASGWMYRVSNWVFDTPAPGRPRQMIALLLLVMLVGLSAWLVFG